MRDNFFDDGIVSFPLGHTLLDEFKKEKVLRSVLTQPPVHYMLDSDKLQRKMTKTARNYISILHWL